MRFTATEAKQTKKGMLVQIRTETGALVATVLEGDAAQACAAFAEVMTGDFPVLRDTYGTHYKAKMLRNHPRLGDYYRDVTISFYSDGTCGVHAEATCLTSWYSAPEIRRLITPDEILTLPEGTFRMDPVPYNSDHWRLVAVTK